MKLAFIFASVLALSACNPSSIPVNNTGSSVVETVCEVSQTAMYAVEAAYNAPATAYVDADSKGLLSAELKARVKPILVEANDYRLKARTAYGIKDASGFCSAAEASKRASSYAESFLPK